MFQPPLMKTCIKNTKISFNHLLRSAKRLYYEERLESTKTNIKTTWKTLNEIKPVKSHCHRCSLLITKISLRGGGYTWIDGHF